MRGGVEFSTGQPLVILSKIVSSSLFRMKSMEVACSKSNVIYMTSMVLAYYSTAT